MGCHNGLQTPPPPPDAGRAQPNLAQLFRRTRRYISSRTRYQEILQQLRTIHVIRFQSMKKTVIVLEGLFLIESETLCFLFFCFDQSILKWLYASLQHSCGWAKAINRSFSSPVMFVMVFALIITSRYCCMNTFQFNDEPLNEPFRASFPILLLGYITISSLQAMLPAQRRKFNSTTRVYLHKYR